MTLEKKKNSLFIELQGGWKEQEKEKRKILFSSSCRVGGKNMMEMNMMEIGMSYATVVFVQILNIQLYRFFETSGLNNEK